MGKTYSPEQKTDQNTESTYIESYRETIVDATKGLLKESDGHRHILRIKTHDETGVRSLEWERISYDRYAELEHGKDYLEVDDVAVYDCNEKDIYTDTWEARIDIHSEFCIDDEEFQLVLCF